MEPSAAYFDAIVKQYVLQNRYVSLGNMMRSPGLKYKDKVFAFYKDGDMVFRLGKEFDPDAFGLKHFSYLSPFKNKPPMKAWFIVSYEEKDLWPLLTDEALQFTKQLK